MYFNSKKIKYLMNSVPKISNEPALKGIYKDYKAYHATDGIRSISFMVNTLSEVVYCSPYVKDLLGEYILEHQALGKIIQKGYKVTRCVKYP